MARGGHSTNGSNGLHTQAHVYDRLASAVRTALDGAQDDSQTIVQATVALPWAHPRRWLAAQEGRGRVYWSSRDSTGSAAGLGEADVVFAAASGGCTEVAQELAPKLAQSQGGVRYYGGMRFVGGPAEGTDWHPFGAFRFVLPRFELRTHAGGATLHCNLVPARDRSKLAELIGAIKGLRAPAAGTVPLLPLPLERADRPTREVWQDAVSWALGEFAKGTLDKVTLAREAAFYFGQPLPPLALLERLASATPQCFHFLFQPNKGPTFLGASPERLFWSEGRDMESEAVAGTRPRGSSEYEDARLRDELFASAKEQREHEFVRVSLQEKLGPITDALTLDERPSEMLLANNRHLVSRVHARLGDGVSSFDVLHALHPTPAVGGCPTQPALAAIREREPFDRGWFAGPVGWIEQNAAEFAVAIRSGLVCGSRLLLYSGAGIVPGSVPSSEWDEIEQKIKGFTTVLGMSSSQGAPDRVMHATALAGT